MWRLSLLLCALGACSAPARPKELARAEELEKRGADEEALAAYASATSVCDGRRGREPRDRWCAAALLGRAQTLERLGRLDEAATQYEGIRLRVDGEPAARGLSEAARLRLALGEEARAYDLYWKVILEHPDELGAEDALRRVIIDGKRRNAAQLAGVLRELRVHLDGTAIADNLLFEEARLTDDVRLYDLYAEQYPDGALRDDALWAAASLLRGEEAARRLRQLLATREQAYVMGSYFSVWLDDAQLRLGVILRDELDDARGAAAAFAKLPTDYPESTLRDDALWEEAATRAGLGETAKACALLARLASKFPDSKWNLSEVPAARTRLGCGD